MVILNLWLLRTQSSFQLAGYNGHVEEDEANLKVYGRSCFMPKQVSLSSIWPSVPFVTGGVSGAEQCVKSGRGMHFLNTDHESHYMSTMHYFLETREHVFRRHYFILVTAEEKSQEIKLKSQVPAVIGQVKRLSKDL